MAGNGIPFLPNDTFFSNTMLERIDLSENSFQQITFEITHLRHLKVLDMQKNSIESLNTFSRISLDKLYNHQNKETSETDNHSLLADLRGNPFSCSCQSLDFLKWFVSSPVFKYTRHQYSCKIDGQTIPMNVAAVSAAQDECEKPIRRKRKLVLLSVLPTIAAFAVLSRILWIIKKRRERLRQRRLEDRIKLIQDGDIEEKFLVFLSFSSDDERFVAANILQPLKVSKISRSATEINRSHLTTDIQ